MAKKVVGRQPKRHGRCRSALRYAGCASVLWLGITLGSALAATAVLIVDEDGRDCPERTHRSIQQAVDDAIDQAMARSENEATPIRVCPGTYRERVRIQAPRDLEIEIRGEGDAKDEVVIKGDNSGAAGPIIDVRKAGTVRLRDFTVDGQSQMEPEQDGGPVWGIRYRKASGSISHVNVRNIRNANGDAQGIGIHIQGADDAASSRHMRVEIQSAHVSNATRVGILADGHGVRATIEASGVTGPVDAAVWAPNGIQVSRGAEGEVRRNTVQGIASPVPGSIGAGILIHCAGPSRVKANAVSHSDVAVGIADTQGADVEQNDLTFNGFGLVVQTIGHLFGDPECGTELRPPRENRLQDNRIAASDAVGIQYKSFDLDVGVPRRNTAAKNVIDDQGFFGIHVVHGRQNRFHDNVISDDSAPHIVDETTGDGTAGTANEWEGNVCPASELDLLCSDTMASAKFQASRAQR